MLRPVFSAMALVCCFGCAHKGIVRFDVGSELTCKNTPVLVEWAVDGAASLHAEPAPAGWVDGNVPSKSTRSVVLNSDTTFTLTALDANPASGERTGSKSVKVSPPREDHATSSASCDESTQTCTGSFTLTSTGNLSALSVSDPRIRRAGQVTPVDLCVTPPGATQICIKAGESAAVARPASGTWTLRTSLKSGDPATPPPQLRVAIDFGCP